MQLPPDIAALTVLAAYNVPEEVALMVPLLLVLLREVREDVSERKYFSSTLEAVERGRV